MPSENPTDKPSDKAAALVALRDTRERVIACLSDEFAHDRLELEEFERRLGVAHRSESVAELQQLTSDLTGEAAAALVVAAPAARAVYGACASRHNRPPSPTGPRLRRCARPRHGSVQTVIQETRR